MGAQTPDPATTFVFRLATLEQDVTELKKQLSFYVPTRENELQIKNIRDIVDRIGKDVNDARGQLSELNNKLSLQESEAQKREAELRENQAALQIRVLWGALSLIIGILTSVLVGYVTHFFH
ncbi:hypothetical protein [Tengunoibacter tsumagoiensis]|uniref:Uncharacterized protein n=1 Tax=Tengunoibacter tsumagoiensis TaxID=2014871 RepID=A0A401ZWJ7_9CHLR|nr:hypothetical protein [Tengunoibacter tsumagoiensis]GCE11150.1 hypothetical protein KTT_10090 [Tengunoibacter tsumagoiensis]